MTYIGCGKSDYGGSSVEELQGRVSDLKPMRAFSPRGRSGRADGTISAPCGRSNSHRTDVYFWKSAKTVPPTPREIVTCDADLLR